MDDCFPSIMIFGNSTQRSIARCLGLCKRRSGTGIKSLHNLIKFILDVWLKICIAFQAFDYFKIFFVGVWSYGIW